MVGLAPATATNQYQVICVCGGHLQCGSIGKAFCAAVEHCRLHVIFGVIFGMHTLGRCYPLAHSTVHSESLTASRCISDLLTTCAFPNVF